MARLHRHAITVKGNGLNARIGADHQGLEIAALMRGLCGNRRKPKGKRQQQHEKWAKTVHTLNIGAREKLWHETK